VVFFTASSNTSTKKDVNFFTGGDDIAEYSNITMTSFTVSQRTFTVQGPSGFVYVNVPFLVTVYTVFSPPNGIVVTPFGADLNFSQSTLNFGNNITAITFSVTPLVANEEVTIHFSVSGPDVNIYSPITTTLSYNIYPHIFFNSLMNSDYYQGVTSFPNYLSIDTPSLNGVTATPICQYATFTPSQLVFANSTTSLSYTITPSLNYAGDLSVSFVLTGPDAGVYAAPTGFTTAAAGKRPLQLYPSPDTLAVYVGFPSGPYTISLDIAPTYGLSVNLSGEFLTVTPSYLTFSPGVTAQTFTFISTVPGVTYLQALLSGIDASLYTPLADSSVVVSQRSIYTSSETVYVQQNSRAAVTVYASVGPTSGVQVIPTNPNLIFTPGTVSFLPGQTSKPLTITGQVAGSHKVRFQVVGPDADYYTAVIDMTVLIEIGVSVTPPGYLVSAGTRLISGMSISVFAILGCAVALLF